MADLAVLGFSLDLQISDAGLVNFVFTKWLRPTYAGQKYALFALNSLNLHRAPVPLLGNTVYNWVGITMSIY